METIAPIEIRELGRLADGRFEVGMRFGGAEEHIAVVGDPFAPEDEALLAWYFEEHREKLHELQWRKNNCVEPPEQDSGRNQIGVRPILAADDYCGSIGSGFLGGDKITRYRRRDCSSSADIPLAFRRNFPHVSR